MFPQHQHKHRQLGHTLKDYGASAYWKGVPEVRVLWNIGLAN